MPGCAGGLDGALPKPQKLPASQLLLWCHSILLFALHSSDAMHFCLYAGHQPVSEREYDANSPFGRRASLLPCTLLFVGQVAD